MAWYGVTKEVDEENVKSEQNGEAEREPDNKCA